MRRISMRCDADSIRSTWTARRDDETRPSASDRTAPWPTERNGRRAERSGGRTTVPCKLVNKTAASTAATKRASERATEHTNAARFHGELKSRRRRSGQTERTERENKTKKKVAWPTSMILVQDNHENSEKHITYVGTQHNRMPNYK